MRKLLSLSSLVAFSVFLLTVTGCKAKKVKQTKVATTGARNAKGVSLSEEPEIDRVKNDDIIIHKPGTMNQKRVDSTKGAQMKLKRMYTK
jgi:hypothetical protein